MNSIQVREQIISFLLQQLDGNARVIEELQKKLAEYQKAEATVLNVTEKPKKVKPEEVK